jgi:hypothetical protein
LLKLRLDFRVEVFETLAAMADHRRAERLEGFFADLDGTGDVQFDVCHKLFVNFFTSLRARQVLSPGQQKKRFAQVGMADAYLKP